MNKNNNELTIDLHGLYVEEAVGFVKERLESLKNSGKTLSIITGAGNHSKDKALIKPKIFDMIKQFGYTYTEVNEGTIDVLIK
jgi:DNA-nicking Smr family endonuclease